MYSMFFDDYKNPLVRVDTLSNVRNGSRLIVAPHTQAYISDGSQFDGPYMSGVHTLKTDIGWFRTGVQGCKMYVYRIATSEHYLCKSGTGEFYFKHPGLPIRCSGKAPYKLSVKIANGNLFIERVLGYKPVADCETLDQFLTFQATGVIRRTLQNALNRQEVQEVDLVSVADAAARELRPKFWEVGIALNALTIDGLNLEKSKLYEELEAEAAKLKVICDDDRYFYLQYLMATHGKATPADLMAMNSMMPAKEATPPDAWGGI